MMPLSSESQSVAPKCPVFDACGGCEYQHLTYFEELAIKEKELRSLLDPKFHLPDEVFAPIVPSPKEYHYRHRLDLKYIKTKQDKILIGFTPKEGRGILEIDQCPIAREEVSRFIPDLKQEAAVKGGDKYRRANLTVRCGGDDRVFWGGIGRRSLRLSEENYLWAEIEGRKVFYSLDTFFQANLAILPRLFEELKKFSVWGNDVVFYDLYGGVGLFSIGLIDNVGKAVLIENCKPAVKLAEYNRKVHGLDKRIQIVEGDVEHYIEEALKQASGKSVAMIDPPRAGLSEKVCDVLAKTKVFGHLFYLSCSPKALARDLAIFIDHHWEIQRVVPFDFFPKTKHLETLVFLKRKDV